jgi:hypothetical protein
MFPSRLLPAQLAAVLEQEGTSDLAAKRLTFHTLEPCLGTS